MSRQLLACCLAAGILASHLVDTTVQAKSPWQWVSFRREGQDKQNPYALTDDAGPWLIFATSFAGEGAQDEAKTLAEELRKKLKRPTYVHSHTFDFSETIKGQGINTDLSPKIMKYDKSGAFEEYAVLVGDFASIDDADLPDLLEKIKTMQPESLTRNAEQTTRRFAGLRALHRRLNSDEEKQRKGPMGKAFASPNPLLPREYFAPRGVNSFVLKMNKGVDHSLLKCPGPYSLRVATFRGNVVIDQRKVAEIEQGGEMPSQLEQAALKAHRLTQALRKKGVEAYEFHDEHESYVTIGSFDWVGRPRADGKQEMNPAIVAAIQEYGPRQKSLTGEHGEALSGLQPRTLEGISFDVQPWPVEVPRASVAKDYARSDDE